MSTKDKASKALEYVVKARLLFDEALQEFTNMAGTDKTELSIKHGIASYETQEAIASLIGEVMAIEIEKATTDGYTA